MNQRIAHYWGDYEQFLREGFAFCVLVNEDLASANGTFVNGKRLKLRQPLQTGDRLRVGSTEFVFSEAG